MSDLRLRHGGRGRSRHRNVRNVRRLPVGLRVMLRVVDVALGVIGLVRVRLQRGEQGFGDARAQRLVAARQEQRHGARCVRAHERVTILVAEELEQVGELLAARRHAAPCGIRADRVDRDQAETIRVLTHDRDVCTPAAELLGNAPPTLQLDQQALQEFRRVVAIDFPAQTGSTSAGKLHLDLVAPVISLTALLRSRRANPDQAKRELTKALSRAFVPASSPVILAALKGGRPAKDLIDVELNIRMGTSILAYYLERERGDYRRALGRYNGSLGRREYPDLVLGRLNSRWRR